jgi:hypothetical protein
VAKLELLARLGLKTRTFGRLFYVDPAQEYPRTQEIAEAVYFHGRHRSLAAPSAGPVGPGEMAQYASPCRHTPLTAAIRDASVADGVFVSPVTGWEVGLLSRSGRTRSVAFLPDPAQ